MAVDRSFLRLGSILPAVKIALEKFLNIYDAKYKQVAPQTATGTATLTAAQMLGGILVATPAAAAAYTVLTGALLEAALRAINPVLEVNDTFDLTVINLGGTTNFDITMTAAAGVTFVGEVVLRPGVDAATEHAGQGTWRFRFTATSTFIAYRVA